MRARQVQLERLPERQVRQDRLVLLVAALEQLAKLAQRVRPARRAPLELVSPAQPVLLAAVPELQARQGRPVRKGILAPV
jgi:hypothetical protein